MEAKRIEIVPFILTIGGIIIVEKVVIKLPFSSIVVTGFARFIEIALIVSIFSIFQKNGTRLIGLSKKTVINGFKQGLIWSACFGIVAGISGIIIFTLGLNPFKLVNVNLPLATPQIVLFFIIAGIVAPIAEELFFRGVFYGFVRGLLITKIGKLGVAAALVLSTLLFVVAHSGNTGLPLPQLIGGVVFCLAYEIEKSLLTPILIHSLGNLSLFTISLIAQTL